MKLSANQLIAGCRDDAFDAGIGIRVVFEPLGGAGAPVKPAVYEGGRYQIDKRWWAPAGETRQPTDTVVIDNVPSQANRLEAALSALRERLGLPELVLDLATLNLPPHLPRQVSSFLFPHRNADAYLRDAALDGKNFMSTPIGKSLFAASADVPDALFAWIPQALLYGFWQSHLGKKRAQTKLARSWTSEIVGFAPATVEAKTLGMKGDPLNLSIDEGVRFEAADHTSWQLTGAVKTGRSDAKVPEKERLSEIGHGQVLADGTAAAVSFAEIIQQATVSFAGLRRIRTSAEGRALLVAIGLAAQVGAFGRACSLRSGCELRPTATQWTWLGAQSDEGVDPLTIDEAVDLVAACAKAAESTGLPVGSRWQAPVMLTPQSRLAEVIRKTWPDLGELDETVGM